MSAPSHDRWSDELSAYLLGALEPEGATAFERHLEGCEHCREEARWLAPALAALAESVERREPSPALRERLLAEAREDARHSGTAAREGGFLAWLRGGGARPRWQPLAGLAAVVLIAAAVVGYEVGSNGSDGGTSTSEVARTGKAPGIVAAVVMEGEHGEIKLSNIPSLPRGKVLEAWVERDGTVEGVPTLFVPDGNGRASTTLGEMDGVATVMVTAEPPGGSAAPTSKPIATVPIPEAQ